MLRGTHHRNCNTIAILLFPFYILLKATSITILNDFFSEAFRFSICVHQLNLFGFRIDQNLTGKVFYFTNKKIFVIFLVHFEGS